MELALSIAAIAHVATKVALEIRKLCDLWKDAPRDVYHLCDELETAEAFFQVLQTSFPELDCPPTSKEFANHHHNAAVMEGLGRLLLRSRSTLRHLQKILDELVGGKESDTPDGSVVRFAKRRKLLWLRHLDGVSRLRRVLRHTNKDIGLFLTLLNV